MKRVLARYSLIAASFLILAVPVIAAEETMSGQKDECMLVAKNCGNTVDSLMQRIDRLNGEIAKGPAVYTTDELAVLKGKLNDAHEILNGLISGS